VRLGDIAWQRPAGTAFVVGIGVSLAAFTSFYLYCERLSGAAVSAGGYSAVRE